MPRCAPAATRFVAPPRPSAPTTARRWQRAQTGPTGRPKRTRARPPRAAFRPPSAECVGDRLAPPDAGLSSPRRVSIPMRRPPRRHPRQPRSSETSIQTGQRRGRRPGGGRKARPVERRVAALASSPHPITGANTLSRSQRFSCSALANRRPRPRSAAPRSGAPLVLARRHRGVRSNWSEPSGSTDDLRTMGDPPSAPPDRPHGRSDDCCRDTAL